MTLNDVIDAVDIYKIHDHLTDINKSYLASQMIMFTDGEIHSGINSDGYINVDSVTGEPTYFIYVDNSDNITLDIYKNIPEYKFKDIINYVNMMRQQTGIKYHGRKKNAQTAKPQQQSSRPVVHQQRQQETSTANIDESLIDINAFKCPKCNNIPKYIENKHGIITGICSHCGVEYYFEPSRYYIMTAKRNYIRDSNKYSRNINITDTSDK